MNFVETITWENTPLPGGWRGELGWKQEEKIIEERPGRCLTATFQEYSGQELMSDQTPKTKLNTWNTVHDLEEVHDTRVSGP